MKTVLVLISIILSGCITSPEQTEYNNATSDCWKARKEYYCKNTESGLKALPKKIVRTGLEWYFGTDIEDQCAKEYASWGYDFRAPLSERLILHCGEGWYENFWGEPDEEDES